jgi:Mn2+/Fe2+ NRAMP family transporter
MEKITKDILNKIINELKKEENQKRLEVELFNPLLIKFADKLYPYIKILFIIFILNFILVLIILILIILFNCKKSIYNNNEIVKI